MNKKFLMILIIILIVVGYFLYKNYYAPKVISTTSETVLSCNDNGGFDIYDKGFTFTERNEPGDSNYYESPDYCEKHPKAGMVLRESWCEGFTHKTIRTTCGYGYVCADGACVEN